jgi:hypothetical protein
MSRSRRKKKGVPLGGRTTADLGSRIIVDLGSRIIAENAEQKSNKKWA